jgi:uncharacterized repeat protein (TIGR01451 family)
VSLRFAFTFIAVVLISGFESDSHRKSSASLGIAPAFAAEATRADDVAARAGLSSSYGKLPISFEANEGQTAGVVQYLARGAGYTLFLTPGEMVLSLQASARGTRKPDGAALPPAMVPPAVEGADKPAAVRMRLIGSNKHAQALGVDMLPGKTNYLMGRDPAKWHTDIPTYAKVRYQDVYPGIELVYYGNQDGKLEHDFVVAAGADPQQIEFDLSDEDRTPVLKDGGVTLHSKAGDIRLQAAVAYQVMGGERRAVAATYRAAGSGAIGFRLGSYDSRYPLVIDPVLVYSAVFGGSSNRQFVENIAIDRERNVYVTGTTLSDDFPLVNPFQSSPGLSVAFVSKLNSSGTALVYSTYLGWDTSGQGIAVDATGRAYITGNTMDYGFPLVNAYQPTFGGLTDAFLSVLTPAGNALEWSTFLGAADQDGGMAVALDPSGNVYVAGFSGVDATAAAGSFPRLHGIPGAQCEPNTYCGWVVKFNSTGMVQYSTVYGNGMGMAVAVDADGSAYITGVALKGTPTTPGAFRSACVTDGCPFVAKLSPAGNSLLYATTLGPTVSGGGAGIAVDSERNAYVAGYAGPGLPVWRTGFRRTSNGGTDGFVVKVNATGSNLIWSTYLGGSAPNIITGLAVDQHRTVYVSGYTGSPDFPLKSPIQGYSGAWQFFVSTLSPSLSSIQYYSTYFGSAKGYNNVAGAKIAVDPALNVYVTGMDQGNVPPTAGAYTYGSSRDIFVSKLVIMDDLSLALSASPSPVVQGGDLTYTISVTSKGPDFGVNVRVSDTLPSGTTFVSYDAGGGTCTAPAVGSTGTLNCRLAELNKGATWHVKLTVHVIANPGTTLSNIAATISNMQDFVTSNNSATMTTHVN